jgi:hypothetical protein
VKGSGRRRNRGTFPSSQHLRGRGACWSSEMGLRRIDKLHSLTRACTKPSPSGYCIVEAPLVLGRAMGNTDTQDSPRPGLGEATTFPLIVYSMTRRGGGIQMAILSRDSRDSRVGVPKSRIFRTPATLRLHNFRSRPPIDSPSEAKL